MKDLLRLLRPHQWLKNGFVFIGPLFGTAWNDAIKISGALYAFAAFCLLASGVYVMNDLIDREQDRRHPLKRQRPLASGAVGVAPALVLMAACLAGGFALVMASGSEAPWLFFAYVALNVAYTLGLKHVVVLDVFLIAAGFMLRLLAGTLGLGIAPSQWLLLCGLMLTLFLGFAKRRAEMSALSGQGAGHRRVLEHYSSGLLDQMMTVTTAGTIISYSLYTVSPDTVAAHGTKTLIGTVPLVIYGMFRYLYLLHRRGGGGDPALLLVTDRHLLAAFAGWLALVIFLLWPGPL
ncbi:MAG TPA: decaprenyl-phosphate phosphoribosyltransferase [Rhodocyclaceae bacterium]|nr:decaprenyl-phosphate phosphoribosyltransferase [Rhodocyclaceae bacterium]